MTSTPTPPPDEPGSDAWLTAALRHAPDADAVPPAALSAAILQRARDAAVSASAPASPARPRVLEHLMALWNWLARPPVATAFASVMVATVVGLMWWDRPLQEALPPREGPVASPAVPAAEPASTPAPQTSPAAVAPKAVAPERSTAAGPAPRPPPGERASRTAPAATRDDAARKTSNEAAPATGAATAGDAAEATRPAPTPAMPEARREQADEAPRDAAAPAGRAQAPAAPMAAAAPAMRERQSLATLPRESRAMSPTAPTAPTALTAPTMPTTPSALLAALRAHPQRWSWQHGAADAQPLTPALLQWLVDVDNAVGAGWRAVPAEPASATPTLQLARDGRLQTSLHLDADRVRLTFGNTAYEGALNADTRQRLQATLPLAPR